MAKLSLTDITSGYLSPTAFNANNSAIEAAMENTLSRDGTSPNTMSAALDMNSNKINNLTDGTNNQDAVTVAQLNAATILGGGTLAALSDTDMTGVASGDLIYYNGTTYVDTAGLFTWDGAGVLELTDAAGAGISFDTTGAGSPWGAGDWLYISEVGAASGIYWETAALGIIGTATVESAGAPDYTTDIYYNYLYFYSPQYGHYLGNVSIVGCDLVMGNDITGGDIYWYAQSVPQATGVIPLWYKADTDTLEVRDGIKLRIRNTTDTDYMDFSHDGTDFNIQATNTTDLNFDGFTDIDLMSGMGLNFLDSTNTDRARMYHDGTDFDLSFTGTTDWNISGITAIQAGGVDADFDAITGTSFGGITEAFLVDKTANEVISGEWSVISVPRNKTTSYEMVLGDAGQTVRTTGSTAAQTITIPANASVAFPIGTLIGIENDSSVDWSLAITSDTLTWSKDNTTGTRTLGAGASAVIHKTTATTWKISGSALVT